MKPGLVQTQIKSGLGQPRLKRLAHSNLGETASHASSESHMSGESMGCGVTQMTRHLGQRRMAKYMKLPKLTGGLSDIMS